MYIFSRLTNVLDLCNILTHKISRNLVLIGLKSFFLSHVDSVLVPWSGLNQRIYIYILSVHIVMSYRWGKIIEQIFLTRTSRTLTKSDLFKINIHIISGLIYHKSINTSNKHERYWEIITIILIYLRQIKIMARWKHRLGLLEM